MDKLIFDYLCTHFLEEPSKNMKVPGKKETIQTKKGNYYLYLQDCLTGMSDTLKPNSIDVIVTSPPYNLGVNYKTYDDTGPREEYLRWIDRWAVHIQRVLSEEGSLFLNMGSKPSDLWVPFEVLFVVRKHFKLQNVIHWIKSIYIEQTSYKERLEINVGHYKPVNSKRFLNDMHEYVFHFTKSGKVHLDRLAVGVPYKDESNISRWEGASRGIRCRGNVWYIPYDTIQSRSKERPHPATFTPKLAEMCIQLHGVEKTKVVMDPFMGLGNTALGCLNLPLDFVGYEIDEYYFGEAVRRISSES